ncbi:MAG: hypothetical protein K6A80_05580 [Saccharofermentans sp.]|nr:hypothetical protein [Saccharofermentans sp.]
MIYTDGLKEGFKSSTEMDAIVLNDIRSTYRKGAVFPSAVVYIICSVVWYGAFFSSRASRISSGIRVSIGIVTGLCALFILVMFISSLVLMSRLKQGKFTWTTGEITGYELLNEFRGFHKYAVIDGKYYCSTWGNPRYPQGTEVYFMSFGSKSSWKQNLVIKR